MQEQEVIGRIRQKAWKQFQGGRFASSRQVRAVVILLRRYVPKREQRLSLITALFGLDDEDTQAMVWGSPGPITSTKELPSGFASALLGEAFGDNRPGSVPVADDVDGALRWLVKQVVENAAPDKRSS